MIPITYDGVNVATIAKSKFSFHVVNICGEATKVILRRVAQRDEQRDKKRGTKQPSFKL